MGDVLDVVLPWLSGPMQWIAAALVVAVVASSWVAVFTAVIEEDLSLVPAVVVSTLSVALGVGVLSLGRWIAWQMGPEFVHVGEPGSGAAGMVPVAFFLLVGEVVAAVFLLMGYALERAVGGGGYPGSGETTNAFRVIVGAGLGLWIAHEIVVMVYRAHGMA